MMNLRVKIWKKWMGSDADAATTTASFQIGEKVFNRGIIEHCHDDYT